MNKKRLSANWPTSAIIFLIMCLISTVLATSRCNSSSRFADPSAFLGCYASMSGDQLQLTPQGKMIINGAAVGTYRIISPVGGKHGYLIEVEGLNLELQGGKVVAKSGDGGFQWKISDDLSINMIFAPSYRVIFQRITFC